MPTDFPLPRHPHAHTLDTATPMITKTLRNACPAYTDEERGSTGPCRGRMPCALAHVRSES